jgi:HlyD family secretion protein
MSLVPKARGKISTATLLWTAAGSMLLIVIVWLAWPRALTVQTAKIDRGVVTREVVEDARVEVRDLYAVTAPVTGRLERIELKSGDTVKAGQTVAIIGASDASLLDPRVSAEAQSAVNAARAAVRAAEANQQLARDDQARTNQLAKTGFASPAALDRANKTLAGATADLAARQADLNRALAAAGYRTRSQAPRSVRSPVTGTVLRVLEESATDVLVGALLMEIGDPRDLEVVGEFLSQDAVLMQSGAHVTITGAAGEAIDGRVRVIEPYARTKVSALGVEEQRVNVVIDFEAAKQAPNLGHGYQVEAGVQVFRAPNALRIPTDALVRHNGGWATFIVENGHARLREIKAGNGDDSFRVIDGGLSEGDSVILFPGDTIRDGDLVSVPSG